MNQLTSFQISEKELCDRFEKTWTPAVNDVLRELGYLEQTLPNNIMPLREHMRVCGIAFTVKGAKNLTQEGEMEKRAEMLEALGENTVAVWDTSGDDQSAQWGEIMTMAAKARGEMELAKELLELARIECGKFEWEIGRYFDHGLYFSEYGHCQNTKPYSSDNVVQI